jgi:hypothetical protein
LVIGWASVLVWSYPITQESEKQGEDSLTSELGRRRKKGTRLASVIKRELVLFPSFSL